VKANNKETCRCRRASGARWGSTPLSLSNGVSSAASRLHRMRELKRSGVLAQREEPREEHREAVYEKALEIVERGRAVGS